MPDPIPAAATCHGCGVPLPPNRAPGRARKWCSDPCRKRALYAGTCESCGGPTDGSQGRVAAPKRCVVCTPRAAAARAGWTAIRDAHYHEVQRLWRAGLTMREIAARMDTTKPTVGTWLYRMRRDGWDVPYRYRRTDLASIAERHRTQADGPPPSRGGGPSSPAGAAAQPFTHNGGPT